MKNKIHSQFDPSVEKKRSKIRIEDF